MRPAEGKTDCLVLDFAGNVQRHGPITDVNPRRESNGKPVTKKCPDCGEIVSAGSRKCPVCGHVFPEPEHKEREVTLALDGVSDIMGRAPTRSPVRGWWWHVSKSRNNGTPMLVVDYALADLSAPPVKEYLCLMHGGYAEEKAFKTLRELMRGSGVLERYPLAATIDHVTGEDELKQIAAVMRDARAPDAVQWCPDGRYTRVTGRIWEEVSSDGDPADRMERYDTAQRSA